MSSFMPRNFIGILVGVSVLCSLGAPGYAQDNGLLFHVADFGAVPDTAEDMGPAIREAIAAAKEAGPGAVVQLDSGVYRVATSDTDRGNTVFHVNEVKGLTIQGQEGTELIVTEPRAACFVSHSSEDFFIKDLTIDYDPPPFTQGVVVEVNTDEGWFALDITEGFPTLSEPWFAMAPVPFGRWGMIFDPEERRLKTNAPDFIFVPDWEHYEDRVYRIFPVEDQVNRLNHMDVGDRFVHMARGGGGTLFFAECRNSGVENVVVHTSPALVLGSQASDRIIARGLHILFREGTDRLLTANADGVHVQQNLRGPIIEDCVFEGMADDSVNLYYYPNTVKEVISDTEFLVQGGGLVRPGDMLQFFESYDGRVLGEARVLHSEGPHTGEVHIIIDRPVASLEAGQMQGAIAGHEGREGTTVFNLSRCNRGFVIRNNVFRMHRRHGMMIKAPNGIIEGNLIDRVAGNGIVIGNDADWPEGVIPNDVLVQHNEFRDIGYSLFYGPSPTGAAIQVQGMKRGHRFAEDRLTRHITLLGNHFVNPPGAAVLVGSAWDIDIIDNTVLNEHDLPRSTSAILLRNVEGVRVTGLHIENHAENLEHVIEVDAASAEGVLGLRTEDIQLRGSHIPPEMDDAREAE